jgi:hypothetical protein
MSATADTRALLDKIEAMAAKGDIDSEKVMASLADALRTMNVTLQDICAVLEKPEEKEGHPDIVAAINNLRIVAPDVIVNVPQAKSPDVKVTVQPAQVVVMPSPEQAPRGWKFSITHRDGNGAIRSISMQPE